MKRLLTLFAVGALWAGNLSAQISPEGRVLDQSNGKSLEQATISVWGPVRLKVQTDASGRYHIGHLPTGRYTITVTAPGYEAQQFEYKHEEGSAFPALRLIPIKDGTGFSVDQLDIVEDISDDGASRANMGSLLSASRDPFNNAASFAFSPARFNRRGYDSPYAAQYLNGVPMNDLNTGYSVWSLWGGLNDMTRNQTQSEGLEPIDVAFGHIGATSNLEMRASKFRAQRRLTYSNSNRTYSNRYMLSWATGKMANGWSLALSAGRRSGNGEYSYVRGQHYDAWSYLLAVEKQLDTENSLSLIAFGAPTRRGVASASTQEAYDLVGSNYYNPNLGYQSGKWRNARERNNHEPVVQLSHHYDNANKLLQINTTLSYRFGRNAYSSLNWYNAPDPRPDYYRYLPSYFTDMAEPGKQDKDAAAIYADLWQSDPLTRYINWDQLYQINRSNTAPLFDASGKPLATGARALYMIEQRHSDQREFGAATTLGWVANSWLSLDAGLSYRYNRTAHYDEVGDLLGADYVYDIDKFAERDFGGDPNKYQIDLRNPDHIARQGDRFGYDYDAVSERAQGWINLKYKFHHLDAYTALSVTQSRMYRVGNQQRGLFPNESLGESKHISFTDLAAKMGLTYKISGQHFLLLNAAYIEQAPYFNNVFVSPRTRNTTIDNPTNERIISADLSYAVRLPWLRGRLTAFYTRVADKSRTMNFYSDKDAAFSNYMITGIATRHIGLELGLEGKLSPTLTLNGALALGRYQYDSNPSYLQTIDNSNKIIDRDIIYWKGLNTSGTPQTAATMGLTYRAPWYATFGISGNYFGRNFVAMAPSPRTDASRAALDQSKILPEELKGGFTLDLHAGYSWRIKRDLFWRFNLSVNNVLNNKQIHSGGFEQLRTRTYTSDQGETVLHTPFASKYYYMYGTTFFFNTSLQF